MFAQIKTENDLHKLKLRVMKDEELFGELEKARRVLYKNTKGGDASVYRGGHGNANMPTNAEMLALYRARLKNKSEQKSESAERILRKFKVRSNSGVAVVSVLTKAYPCPGRCIYCPTEENMPKSYLSKEPAAARALMNDFDPYKQVSTRLKALTANGHAVDKIEMIIIGGTWSSYEHNYQEEFITELYRAVTNFKLPTKKHIKKGELNLSQLQTLNENADCRIIGLSIETRPDYINETELNRLRMLTVTKVEIGVQHLDDAVLDYNKRDMNIEQIEKATELLRATGLKIVYHMMPNLPSSTPDMDIKMFEGLFDRQVHHPDMIKIYPCVVLEKSFLYHMWREGEFASYDDTELSRVLVAVKKDMPPYVRIIRVIRDIPVPYIQDGNKVSNFRQVIANEMRRQNLQCKCIRCREVREAVINPDDYNLTRLDYKTTNGKEVFLSFEHKDTKENKCAAFCRLRLPDSKKPFKFTAENLKVLNGSAIIRELHTYGRMAKINEKGSQSQHMGFGSRLMLEAEKIAKEAKLKKMAVISGVGARAYYRDKLGYELESTYMVKKI